MGLLLSQMNQTLAGLATAVTQLSTSTTAKANKPPKSKSSSIASMTGGSLTSVLTRVFGPLIALGTILSSATSGFQLFTGAIRIAATAASAVLLPIFVVFAAGLLTFVDMLTNPEMMENLKSYFEIIISTAIELADQIKLTTQDFRELALALRIVWGWITGKNMDKEKGASDDLQKEKDAEEKRIFGEARATKKKFNEENPDLVGAKQVGDKVQVKDGNGGFRDATDAEREKVMAFNNKLEELNQEFISIPARFAEIANNRRQGLNDDGTRKGDAAVGAAAGGGGVGAVAQGGAAKGGAGANKDKAFGGVFREQMKLVAQELQVSTAPKAQQFSLAAVSRQAQLAALNQSPYEAKMLDLTQKIVGELGKVANKLADQGPAPAGQ